MVRYLCALIVLGATALINDGIEPEVTNAFDEVLARSRARRAEQLSLLDLLAAKPGHPLPG
jgi:hypothetical protein